MESLDGVNKQDNICLPTASLKTLQSSVRKRMVHHLITYHQSLFLAHKMIYWINCLYLWDKFSAVMEAEKQYLNSCCQEVIIRLCSLCSSHCTHTPCLLFKVITLVGQYFHTSIRKPAFMKTLFINSQSYKYFLKSMVLKSISSLLTSKKFMWQSTPRQMFTGIDKYLKTTFISTKSPWLLRIWMISTSIVQDFFFALYSHIPAFPFT